MLWRGSLLPFGGEAVAMLGLPIWGRSATQREQAPSPQC
jgi:hypothetical protein